MGELDSLIVGFLGRQGTLIFTLQLSNWHTVSTQRAVAPFSNIFPNLSASPFSPASVLSVSNEWNDLNALAVAFGETRSTRSVIFLRTETRRGDVGYWNDCWHNSLCLCVSAGGENLALLAHTQAILQILQNLVILFYCTYVHCGFPEFWRLGGFRDFRGLGVIVVDCLRFFQKKCKKSEFGQ